MIEFLGLLYGVAKDIKDYIAWDEDVKLVDREWLETSGFCQTMRDKRAADIGYSRHWEYALWFSIFFVSLNIRFSSKRTKESWVLVVEKGSVVFASSRRSMPRSRILLSILPEKVGAFLPITTS